jgi:hypothetical protein
MRTGKYAPRCLATRVAWPPVLLDDTIALTALMRDTTRTCYNPYHH